MIDTPLNLTVTAIRGGARLTWDNTPINEHGYQVWGSINSASYQLLGTTALNVCTYDDLRTGNTFQMLYKVRAIGGNTLTDIKTRSLIDFTLLWVDDYCKIDFVATNTEHQVWESRNGEAYAMVTNLSSGIGTYNNYTYQNASMNFCITEFDGTNYNMISIIKNMITPLIFKTYQTSLNDVVFNALSISSGALVIDWGDGTHTDWTNTGDAVGVRKSYSTEGVYFVTITGSVNLIRYFVFEYVEAGVNQGNSASFGKWVLPTSLINFHFLYQGVRVTGDISNMVLPSSLAIFDVQQNRLTGTIPKTYPSVMSICHYATNLLSGDLTGTVLFSPGSYSSQNVWDIANNQFTGDLSGTLIPLNLGRIGLNINLFTKFPRGHFANITSYDVSDNQANDAEIDSVLAYIDNYFTGGVVPLRNAAYYFNNIYTTGQGKPTAAGLVSRTSIINKYIAAGRTCTITVNS